MLDQFNETEKFKTKFNKKAIIFVACCLGLLIINKAGFLKNHHSTGVPEISNSNNIPGKTCPRRQAGAIMSEYEANEVAADKSYKGQEIIVSGTVKEIAVSLGSPCISLLTGYPYQYILCYGLTQELAAQLYKGQEITVIGICRGKIITSIALHNCAIYNY